MTNQIPAAKRCAVSVLSEQEPLIHSILHQQYPQLHPNSDDYQQLFSSGRIAVLDGIKTYDSKKGKLTTHLYPRICGALRHCYITEILGLTIHYYENIQKINQATQILLSAGLPLTEPLLSSYSGLSIRNLRTARRIAHCSNVISYDSDDFSETSFSMYAASPEEELIQSSLHEAFLHALFSLSTTEQFILIHHHGLLGRSSASYEWIAQRTSLSLRKLRTIEHTALQKLRSDPVLSEFFPNAAPLPVKKRTKGRRRTAFSQKLRRYLRIQPSIFHSAPIIVVTLFSSFNTFTSSEEIQLPERHSRHRTETICQSPEEAS